MFGGVRDSEWTHVLVEGGDRDAAAPYLSEARKLLGVVKQTAAATRNGVVLRRQRLRDGTELVARTVGTIPHVTIKVKPTGGGRTDRTVLDGFITWPIDQNAPDGAFDEGKPVEFPNYVLSPPQRGQSTWITWTFGRFKGFWKSIRGRKDTYEKRRDNTPIFPDGLRFYGNRYWHGTNGIAVSWHGGQSGATLRGETMAVVRTSDNAVLSLPAQYAVKFSNVVYHAGQVLLDLADTRIQPFPNPFRLIAAACVTRDSAGVWWVYALEFTVRSAFRAVDTSYELTRYALTRGPKRAGFDKAEIDWLREGGFRQVLWARGFEVDVDPSPTGLFRAAELNHAEFSPDGSRLLLHTSATFVWRQDDGFGTPWRAHNNDGFDRVVEVDVRTGALIGSTEYRIGTGGETVAPFAFGYDRDNVLRSLSIGMNSSPSGAVQLDAGNVLSFYRIGGLTIPACTWGPTVERRELVLSLPGQQRLLLQRVDAALNDTLGPLGAGANLTFTLELWGADGLIKSWPGAASIPKSTPVGYTRQPSYLLYAGHLSVGRRPSPTTAVPPASNTFAPTSMLQILMQADTTVGSAVTGLHAHQSYVPFKNEPTTSFRYTDNIVQSGGFATFVGPSDGGFHGRAIYGLGFPPVTAYVRFGSYTLFSTYRPGVPDETIVDLIPDGNAAALTGFDGNWLRLHPATVLGLPIFRTE